MAQLDPLGAKNPLILVQLLLEHLTIDVGIANVEGCEGGNNALLLSHPRIVIPYFPICPGAHTSPIGENATERATRAGQLVLWQSRPR